MYTFTHPLQKYNLCSHLFCLVCNYKNSCGRMVFLNDFLKSSVNLRASCMWLWLICSGDLALIIRKFSETLNTLESNVFFFCCFCFVFWVHKCPLSKAQKFKHWNLGIGRLQFEESDFVLFLYELACSLIKVFWLHLLVLREIILISCVYTAINTGQFPFVHVLQWVFLWWSNWGYFHIKTEY